MVAETTARSTLDSYLIPGGGLSPDGRHWIAARPKFHLPVKALGAHFRALFKTRLQKNIPSCSRRCRSKCGSAFGTWTADRRARVKTRCAMCPVTCSRRRPPTGRFSSWLRARCGGTTRDSQTGRHTSIQLEPLEFMGRFLQHILPRERRRQNHWHPPEPLPPCCLERWENCFH